MIDRILHTIIQEAVSPIPLYYVKAPENAVSPYGVIKFSYGGTKLAQNDARTSISYGKAEVVFFSDSIINNHTNAIDLIKTLQDRNTEDYTILFQNIERIEPVYQADRISGLKVEILFSAWKPE